MSDNNDSEAEAQSIEFPDFEDLPLAQQQRLQQMVESNFVSVPQLIENTINDSYLQFDATVRQQQAQMQAQVEQGEDGAEE